MNGYGSQYIGDYMASLGNNHLYYRYRNVDNPVKTEANLIAAPHSGSKLLATTRRARRYRRRN